MWDRRQLREGHGRRDRGKQRMLLERHRSSDKSWKSNYFHSCRSVHLDNSALKAARECGREQQGKKDRSQR